LVKVVTESNAKRQDTVSDMIVIIDDTVNMLLELIHCQSAIGGCSDPQPPRPGNSSTGAILSKLLRSYENVSGKFREYGPWFLTRQPKWSSWWASTWQVERLLLHAESVGRNARVVALEVRLESHYYQRGRRVAWPPLRRVLLSIQSQPTTSEYSQPV